MKNAKAGVSIALAGVLTAYASLAWAAKAAVSDKIFETDITNDLNLSSGEPEIAVDPTNPDDLAIIEFAVGSAKVPTFVRNPIMDVKTTAERVDAMKSDGRVVLSRDGGNTWAVRPPPGHEPGYAGAGDPMIAYGPDGTLYVADEPFPLDLDAPGDMSKYTFVITASTNGGKTFSAPQHVGTPVDRPWLKVDQSTGMVYTASTGYYNERTKEVGKRGDGILDRWLVAWKPHLQAHGEPHRMGGPDFGVRSGSGLAAANGIVAGTIVLGPVGVAGAPSAQTEPSVPKSLEGLLPPGVTSCVPEKPCLFFQTSTDQGRHWTRHYVPTRGEFAGFFVPVAADPGRRGHFAVLYSNGSSRSKGMGNLGSGDKLEVVVTDDSGKTWSGPHTIPETARGKDFKYWLAYGPTGVLGVVWRKERNDLSTARPVSPTPDPMAQYRPWGAAYDIYADISCDGGKTWLAPARVDARTSPSGYVNQDDFSYIALDAHYAHLVWGDRRMVSRVKNAPLGTGGLQVFYGRVPFSVVTRGASCGRQ